VTVSQRYLLRGAVWQAASQPGAHPVVRHESMHLSADATRSSALFRGSLPDSLIYAEEVLGAGIESAEMGLTVYVCVGRYRSLVISLLYH
jgi:hypothetical protein